MKVKIPGYVERMNVELYELTNKIEKLKAFLDDANASFDIPVYREKMMENQLDYMEKYADILVERIGDAMGEITFVRVNEKAEKKHRKENRINSRQN